MNISAEVVKTLREKTGVGFGGPQDPQKACQEYIDLAHEWNAKYFSEGSPFDPRMAEVMTVFAEK